MNKKFSRFLSLVLACATVGSMTSFHTFAETSESFADSGTGVLITAFEPLEQEVAAQVVEPGTARMDLQLPEILAAEQTINGETRRITVKDVLWEASPNYDPDIEDEYHFTAVLDPVYLLADGLQTPVIVITVTLSLLPPVNRPSSPEILAPENFYSFVDEDFSVQNDEVWNFSAATIETTEQGDQVLQLGASASAMLNALTLPASFEVEFRARVTNLATNSPPGSSNSLAFQFSRDRKYRLMFSAETNGIYYCSGGTWSGNDPSFTDPTGWHTYRFQVSTVEDGSGTALLFVDNAATPITITLQSSSSTPENVMKFWTTNGGAQIDSFQLRYPMAENAKPLWTAKNKLRLTAATTSSVSVEWDAPVGTVTGYQLYRDGSALGAVLAADQTTYTVSGLNPSTAFTLKVEAINENGETNDGPSLPVKTHYDPSSNTLDTAVVWAGNTNGYGSYRIPGMVVTAQDTVIVYAEARRGGGDWDPMDLIMKRSEDGGNTWGEDIIVVEGLKNGITVNNPVIIVDQDGVTLHLIYCVMYGVVALNGGVYHMTSTDDGKTWSAPNDISADCQPTDGSTRNVIATGPGHAIQLEDGTLMIAIWMTNVEPSTSKAHQPSVVSTLYSEDGGANWQVGEIIPANNAASFPNPNETTVVQLSDGRVMLNIRSQTGRKRRAVSYSADGRSGWSTPVFDEALKDPGCFGSLVRYDDDTILFTNADSENSRTNVSVKASFDDGKSWPISRSLEPGNSAYSDIAVDSKGTIYDLYEDNNGSGMSILLGRMTLDWLQAGSESNLKSLSFSTGTLTPSFSAAVTEYLLEIDESTSKVELTASPLQSGTTVTVNGNPTVDDRYTISDITAPKTKINIVATPSGGAAPKTYQVTIRKILPVPANSLVAHYSFNKLEDDSFSDESNRSNDILSKGVAIEPTGKFGGAAVFDNAEDCLDLLKGNGIDFGSGDFTAALWANPTLLSSADQAYLFWYGTPTAGQKQWWVRMMESGKLMFLIGDGSQESNVKTAGPVMTANRWTHVVLQKRGGDLLVFTDGVQRAKQTIGPNRNLSGEPTLRIGRAKSGAARAWPGMLDEVRLYNYALSEQEILDLYNFDPGAAVCTCVLEGVQFQGATISLTDAVSGHPLRATATLSVCAIIGHSAEVTYTYAPKTGGSNTANASINGAILTATQVGSVEVTVTAAANGSSKTADATFVIQPAPPTTHIITASADAGGTISPAGAVSVTAGSNQTFAITPADAAQRIADVKVDGVSVGALASYTFTDVQQAHTIAASFVSVCTCAPQSIRFDGKTITLQEATAGYPLSATATLSGCAISGHSAQITYTYVPKTGGSNTANASINGAILTATQVGSVEVTVTATANGSAKTADATFVIQTEAPASYIITASAGAGGTISPSGAVSVTAGSNQTFAITPADAAHRIEDVKVDGVSVGVLASYTFTNVQRASTIEAIFAVVCSCALENIQFDDKTISLQAAVAGYPLRATTSLSACAIPGHRVEVAYTYAVKGGGVNTANATVRGATLTAPQAGIVEVTVTAVANGSGKTADAIFTIQPASPASHIITASAGAGGKIAPSGAVSVTAASSQSFVIMPDAFYRIEDVRVDGVSMGAMASYTFRNVQNAHTIEASFAFVSGGGSGGSGGNDAGGNAGNGADRLLPPAGGAAAPGASVPGIPAAATTNTTAAVDANGNASVIVPQKNITDAIKLAQDTAKKNGVAKDEIAVVINVDTGKAAQSLSVTLPHSAVGQLVAAGVSEIKIQSALADVSLDRNTLKAAQTVLGGATTVQVSRGDVGKLSPAAQAAIGNKGVFSFSITGNGKTLGKFNGGSASVSIPYDGAADAKADSLSIVFVDENGGLNQLIQSGYDADSKAMVFSTNHFSTYGVAYRTNIPAFADVKNHWAGTDIAFVTARGLLLGEDGGQLFAPDDPVTRAMLVTALGRIAGADVSVYKQSRFADVKADAAYLGYAEWAVSKGIITGTSATAFSPKQGVSREEMAVILANYTKATGFKTPTVRDAVKFADENDISANAKSAVAAMQQAGIVMGKDGNRFDPMETATRAQASALLRRYVELQMNRTSAQGFDKNDSGGAVFYEKGRPGAASGTPASLGAPDAPGIAQPDSGAFITHTIVYGDTLWDLSIQYDCSLEQLVELNHITTPNSVPCGTQIQIPLG